MTGQPVQVTLYVRMGRLVIPGAYNISVRQFCTVAEGCTAVGPTLSVLPGQFLKVTCVHISLYCMMWGEQLQLNCFTSPFGSGFFFL